VSFVPGYQNGVLLRTNSQVDSLWLRYYHYYDSVWSAGRGRFRDVVPTLDGGFAAVGDAYASSANPNDPPIYGQDTWVVKVDSMGCLEPGCHLRTGLQSQVTNLRGALSVAPNPAHDLAWLSWELPDNLSGGAQLTITSATGQLVRTEPIALRDASYLLDVSDLTAGLYHLHIVQDGQWLTGGKLLVE